MSIFHLHLNKNLLSVLSLILRIIVPAGIFWYLSTLIDFEVLRDSVINADIYMLCAGMVLGTASFFLQIVKWNSIVKTHLDKYSFGTIARSLFAGYAYGLITPFRAGELPGRKFGLRKNDVTSVSMAVIVDKIFNMAGLLTCGSVLFSLFLIYTTDISFYLIILIPLVVFGLIAGMYLFVKAEKLGKYKILQFIARIEYLKKVKKAFNKSRKMPATFFRTQYLLSVLIFLTYTMQFLFFTAAFEDNFPFGAAYAAIGALYFVKMFIGFISFADLGVRESTAVYFLGKLGVSAAAALGASIMIFSVNLLLPAAIGAVILFKKN